MSYGLKKYIVLQIAALVFLIACNSLFAQFGASSNSLLRSIFQIVDQLERQGQYQDALVVLEPYAADPRVVLKMYELHERSGTLRDFLPLIDERYSRKRDDVNLLAAYIKTLANLDMKDSLTSICHGYAGAKDSMSVERYKTLGNILGSAGLDELAIEYYSQGRQVSGDESLYARQLADLYLLQGKYRRVVDELLENIKDNPGDLPVARRQAFSVADNGGSDVDYLFKRLEYYAKNDTSRQLSYNLQSIWMEAALTTGRDKDAIEALENLFKSLDKPLAEAQFMIFVSNCEKLEKWQLAVKSYDLASQSGVIGSEQSSYEKSKLYFKANRPEQAEAELLTLAGAVQDSSLKSQVLERLGNYYLNFKNDPHEALKWYNALQEHLKQSPAGLVKSKLSIAESLIHLGELGKAREIVDQSKKVSQGNPGNLANSILLGADIMFYEGKIDSAVTSYTTFARLSLPQTLANDAIERAYLISQDKSKDGVVAKTVGEALFMDGQGMYQKAYDKFNKALGLVAEDSDYRALIIYQVGKMYEKSGEYPLAISAYEQLADNYPEHHLAPFCHLAIGKIYLKKTGNPELARTHLEKVVFDYPDGVATGQARRLLRTLESIDL